jgi:hypothetical protein
MSGVQWHPPINPAKSNLSAMSFRGAKATRNLVLKDFSLALEMTERMVAGKDKR